MPTYDYRCPNGHDFDHFFRKISESQPTLPCPVCGAVAQRRMSATAGLVFKGSGFYITDYGKDGKKDLRAGAKAETSGSGASGATAEGEGPKQAGEKGAPSVARPLDAGGGGDSSGDSSGGGSGGGSGDGSGGGGSPPGPASAPDRSSPSKSGPQGPSKSGTKKAE